MRSEAYAKEINAASGNDKRQWDTITAILTNKTSAKVSIDAIQNQSRNIITDKIEIADIFNDYFLNIGRKLGDRISNMINCEFPFPYLNNKSISCIVTNRDEVLNKIKTMKKNNNIHDSMPSNILIHKAYKLAPTLVRLFNDSFRSGQFPNSLKIDRIVPAFKSKDPLLAKNYRPISIPQNFSKIVESIVCDRITTFCNDNRIIAENQYGFQKNSSAMSAVVSVVDYLQVNLNKNPGSIGACVFIDLKKASNTIRHDRLMEKLWQIGIRGPLHDWIKSYLNRRRQFVDIDNTISSTQINTSAISIPQGSALSPLLFLLYINDIFQLQLHGKIILFADDTAIVYVENDRNRLEKQMQKDLKLLNKWFNLNSLSLNTDKTKAMAFYTQKLNLKIRNRPIEFVNDHKYLGIHLQNNLQWDVHIEKMCKEIRAVCGASKKIGHKVERRILHDMYQKLVYNPLSKMAAIYGTFATDTQLNLLQIAQDDAIQTFYASENRNNLYEIFMNHRLLNVKQIIHYDLAILIYKWKYNLLKLNRPINDLTSENVLSAGARYFNSLDNSLSSAQTVDEFKKKLKGYFTK